MHRFCYRVAALVIVILAALNAGPDSPAAENEFKAAADAAVQSASEQPPVMEKDASMRRVVERDLELAYRHREWTQEFKQRSFEWHLLSTRIIFALVIVIVAFGLFITYLQFKRDYTSASYQREPDKPVDANEAVHDPAASGLAVPSKSVTSLKLGPGGLELSSQIIGLAVLAFSLGFFYLYVKNVYPMNEIGVAVKAAAAQEKAAAEPEK